MHTTQAYIYAQCTGMLELEFLRILLMQANLISINGIIYPRDFSMDRQPERA